MNSSYRPSTPSEVPILLRIVHTNTKEEFYNVFYIVRSVHERRTIITHSQLTHCFNISVLKLSQRRYNFARHVSIAIRSSSGAYNVGQNYSNVVKVLIQRY
jgi:hypothetical protein